jgi:hypothetical protein
MSEERKNGFDMSRNQLVTPEKPIINLEVTKITDGLGYGEGSISFNERVDEVGLAIIEAIEAHIASPNVLVPVDVDEDGKMLDDDGCGDGRLWFRVFQKLGSELIERKKSLRRPKVFGGGATMGVASAIANDETEGMSLGQLFKSTIKRFREKQIGFGAHRDNHAHGPNCGCGAIDQAPAIIQNAAKYSEQIHQSLTALGAQREVVKNVLANFSAYSEVIISQQENYEGKAVMDAIIDEGKVVKDLEDEHFEMFVIFSDVEGYTVDQDAIREISNGRAQAFVVDIWRLKKLAQLQYEVSNKRERAFIGELVYTLATAATLTKGDLPVYVINEKTGVPV